MKKVSKMNTLQAMFKVDSGASGVTGAVLEELRTWIAQGAPAGQLRAWLDGNLPIGELGEEPHVWIVRAGRADGRRATEKALSQATAEILKSSGTVV